MSKPSTTLADAIRATAKEVAIEVEVARDVARDDARARHQAMAIEMIASVCHEANRGYCKSLGDDSQPSWDDAPDWQKESACNGVRFHLANPDAGPSGSHENWLSVKKAEGWRYGPVKDAEAKTHPCFVDYAMLPAEQKAKDYIFTAIVHAMRNGIV